MNHRFSADYQRTLVSLPLPYNEIILQPAVRLVCERFRQLPGKNSFFYGRPYESTAIIEGEDRSASMDLAFTEAGHFRIKTDDASTAAREIARAVGCWRTIARELGASARECDRMASAFEHEDLAKARQRMM